MRAHKFCDVVEITLHSNEICEHFQRDAIWLPKIWVYWYKKKVIAGLVVLANNVTSLVQSIVAVSDDQFNGNR
ncbi:hypothetical protein RB195_006672 [Necator americanus]|uniref:Bestrophin homolog n=1 Tax=Necator americanus TaxID=51031 RepID=A0ABR1BXI1_NECAM